jgi:hypothetical protein
MVWSEEFPHLYKIFSLSEINHPDNYFSHMDSGHRSYLATESYKNWEKRLSRLSEAAFKYLSCRAAPYVTHRDKTKHRHWSALFEILNEAKGYEFLLDEGYSTIHFIPQSKEESPDIWAQRDSGEAVLEVKTIQRSDTDLSQRQSGIVRTSVCDLPEGFKRKILEDYEKAIRQCRSIAFPSVTRRICYFCIDLDLEVAMDRSNQNVLENFMQSIEQSDVEIIYESRTWS